MKQRIRRWLETRLAPDLIGLRAQLAQIKKEHRAALAELNAEWRARYVQLKERHRAELLATRRDEAARHERVLVYSLEKTGTVSVSSSLKERLFCPVYHVHHFSPETMEDFARLAEQGDERVRQKLPHWRAKNEEMRAFQGKSRIVTLVRDPVARIVSLTFHVLADMRPQWDVSTVRPAPEEIWECIRDVASWAFDQTVQWFDREVKVIAGIDVFAAPFPHEVGYQIYRNGPTDVLLLRLEDLQRNHQAAFREFLGLENFELKSANVGAEKEYKEAYQHFKRNPCVPASFLDQMYSTRYAKHFYAAAEIERFRQVWRGAILR